MCGLPNSANDNSPQADSEDERSPKNNEMAELYPKNCLFCPQVSSCLTHMKTYHSFSILYQYHLAVETESLICYLHLVIFGFHECISCGKQRNTLEGVQHHMLEKGHGRFDMTDDMIEFYNSEKGTRLKIGLGQRRRVFDFPWQTPLQPLLEFVDSTIPVYVC